MNRPWRAALIAGALLACAAPAQAERPQAKAVDAIDGIVDAFARHPIVALGENHGDVGQHAFLRRLVTDPRFARAVDDIVIEAGSARHQDVMDRFIAGQPVSRRALAATWRDSVGGGALGTWDAPVYERFLRAVRKVNQGRPESERLRVLLGDPPVDWDAVRTREQLQTWGEQRDSHYASVVDREVLRQGRRGLLIAGLFHFHRDAQAPGKSILQHVEEQHPGKVFHVTLPTFDAAADHGEAYAYTRSFPADSLVALDGTDIGALRAPRPPQAPQAPTEEENAEAWLIPDPAWRDWSSTLHPTALDDRWWKELLRRVALEGTVNIDQMFDAHCMYAAMQGRGLPQAVRPGAPDGEPGAASAAAGKAPAASAAQAAVLAKLRAGKVVAIGEARGPEQLHAFLRDLIGSGRLPGRRPLVVAGFGNSRHQRIADRYLAGRGVPAARLSRIWQDTSQLLAYEAPDYAAFFAAVRTANRKLPAHRRIRVLLGEPPLDWGSVRHRRDVAAVAARRAAFMARLVRRHGRGRGVLVVADRRLVARVPGSVTGRLPRGRSWVLQPHVGFGGKGAAALTGKLGDATSGSALRVAGSWLAKLRAGRNLAPRHPGRSLAGVADALLYLGAPETLSAKAPSPALFRDAYVREIRRRHRLLYGRELDPARAFPTSECRSIRQMVGG